MIKRKKVEIVVLCGAFLFFSIIILVNLYLLHAKESKEENFAEEDVITLYALTMGQPSATGLDDFYKQLDALTIPELGCILRLEYIPWGDEREQINIAIASGEYDFIPGGNFSDYKVQATKNAFINLYDYIDLVPELKKHYEYYQKDFLKKCEINQKLYGIPQYSDNRLYGSGDGFFYREDLRKEWGLEPVTNFDTMQAYLYQAKQAENYNKNPLVTDNRIWNSLWYMLASDKYLEIESIQETPYAVVSVEDPYTPISRFETKEFKEILDIIKKWNKDGIMSPSILAASDNEGIQALDMLEKDEKPCETNSILSSLSKYYVPVLYETDPTWEYEFYNYTMNTAPAFVSSPAKNTVISISSKTNYPELAIKLLEKMHTDQRYYNLLMYGVEGENYNLQNGYINFNGIKSEERFGSLTGLADTLLSYEEVSDNPQWVQVLRRQEKEEREKKSKAQSFPLDGFTFYTGNVNDEIENLDNTYTKYLQPLCCGVTDDENGDYDKAIQELKNAGLDQYLSELKNQLENFKEEKQ